MSEVITIVSRWISCLILLLCSTHVLFDEYNVKFFISIMFSFSVIKMRRGRRKQEMQRQELTLEEEFMERDLAMERRLTTMMGIVVGSFVLCWSPFAVMFTIFPFCDDCSEYLKENSWIIEFITWIGESCICKTWLSYFSISLPVPSNHIAHCTGLNILTANKEHYNCYIAGYFNSSLNPMIYYFYYCYYFSKGAGGASRKQSAMSASTSISLVVLRSPWCFIYFEVLWFWTIFLFICDIICVKKTKQPRLSVLPHSVFQSQITMCLFRLI